MPSRLKIGAHEFRVVYASHWAKKDAEDMGYYDPAEGIIYIRDDIPETQQWGTLIHEVFHALNETLDHELLESLAQQWTQVLIDNRLLK